MSQQDTLFSPPKDCESLLVRTLEEIAMVRQERGRTGKQLDKEAHMFYSADRDRGPIPFGAIIESKPPARY